MVDTYFYTYVSGTQDAVGDTTWSGVENVFDHVDGVAISGTYASTTVGKYGTTNQESTNLQCTDLYETITFSGVVTIERVFIRVGFYNEYIGLTDAESPPTFSSQLLPSIGTNVDRDGKNAWSNPNNIISDVSNKASCSIGASTYSDWITATGFAFDIPVLATIKGIEIEAKVKGTSLFSTQYIKTDAIYLLDGDGNQAGDNKAGTDEYWSEVGGAPSYQNQPTILTWGGPSDTWGTGLTASGINSSNFGVRISARNTRFLQQTSEIYYIQVKVYYEIISTDNIVLDNELEMNILLDYNGNGSYTDEIVTDLKQYMPSFNGPTNSGSLDIEITDANNAPATWDVDDLNNLDPWVYMEHGNKYFTEWKTYVSHIQLRVDISYNYGFIIYDENGIQILTSEDGITRVFYDGNDITNDIDVGFATAYNLLAFSYPLIENEAGPVLNAELIPQSVGSNGSLVELNVNRNCLINDNISTSISSDIVIECSTSCGAHISLNSVDWNFSGFPIVYGNYKTQLIGVGR